MKTYFDPHISLRHNLFSITHDEILFSSDEAVAKQSLHRKALSKTPDKRTRYQYTHGSLRVAKEDDSTYYRFMNT